MRHGTNHAYDVHKCRCATCREYKREKDRRRRARLKELARQDSTQVPHGTETGYCKYNCRCARCKEAYGRRRQEWYAQNPEANSKYTRRWREKNPDHAQQYEKEQDRLAGTPQRAGEIWTGAHLEIVVTRKDLTLTQLATLLGRTRRAVALARHRATHDPKWIQVVGVPDASIGDD